MSFYKTIDRLNDLWRKEDNMALATFVSIIIGIAAFSVALVVSGVGRYWALGVLLLAGIFSLVFFKKSSKYMNLHSEIESEIYPEVVKSLKKKYEFKDAQTKQGRSIYFDWLRNAIYGRGYDDALIALTLNSGYKVLFNAVIRDDEVYLEPTPEGANISILESITRRLKVSEEALVVDGYTLEEFRDEE